MSSSGEEIGDNENDLAENRAEVRQSIELLEQLQANRKNHQTDVHLYLLSIEQLARNQTTLLKNSHLLHSLPFELMFDVLFDYGRELTPFRDEFHVFRAALDWLCKESKQVEREQFSADIMKLVQFERMNSSQLRAAFEMLSRIKLSDTLKQYLQKTQKRLIAQNLLHHSLVFIECPKV